MAQFSESRDRCRNGLNIEKPSMHGHTRNSEEVIKPRPDSRTHRPHPGSARACDRTHGEYHHETESNHISCSRESPAPKDKRRNQNWHESSKAGDRFVSTPKSSSQSSTLDFEKMRLSPRKYMHPKGGDSGLSKISSMRDYVAQQPPDLMLQSDCARDLKKAIHQRCGKDPRHQGDRKFDYGLE